MVFTTVPSGTRMIRSSPAAPLRLDPEPGLPLPARRTGRRWKSSSVAAPGSTSTSTSPPRPPLPPSGPPSGLNFSRCIEAQPCPPSPACTRSSAWSANSATDTPPPQCARGGPIAGPPLACLCCCDATAGLAGLRRRCLRYLRSGFDDAHGPTPAPGAELDLPADEGEQGIVPAAANADSRMEVSAVLAHDDLAGVDDLAAEALDAEPLGIGVAAVPAGRRALLVCHLRPSSSSWRAPHRRRC